MSFCCVLNKDTLKEQIINAEKALQTAQSKDMSSVLKELNDKRARLDEIDIFLGRVEDNSPQVERAIARYGDEYKAIIADKFAKEDAQSGASDIVFAPKRENLNKIQAKNDIIPAKKQGEKMLNDDLQELFTSNNRVDYEKIKAYAKPSSMPKPNFKNYGEFRALFDNVKGNIGFVKTPYAPVKVKIFKAYEHFTKNTNNTNRENIKGGFFSTLQEPLLVVKGERVGQNEPSVYFYKPFLSKDKNGKESVMNLFSIAVDYSGNLDFKTYYLDNRSNRLKSVVDSVLQGKGEVLYIKSPNG